MEQLAPFTWRRDQIRHWIWCMGWSLKSPTLQERNSVARDQKASFWFSLAIWIGPPNLDFGIQRESTSVFHLTIFFFILSLADILAVLLTDVLLLLQEKDQKYTFASVVCTFPGSISKQGWESLSFSEIEESCCNSEQFIMSDQMNQVSDSVEGSLICLQRWVCKMFQILRTL